MGIFSMRRRTAERSAPQRVKNHSVRRAVAEDIATPREVEFVCFVPAPHQPAPPAPKQSRPFLPIRTPFSYVATNGLVETDKALVFGADAFIGDLADGLPLRGTWRFADGGSFEQKPGMEHVLLPCGSHYFGDVAEGQPTGEGLVQWFSGDTYAGAFVGGLPCGPGTWRFPDGHKVELPEGITVARYDGGAVTYGPVQQGLWHGNGVTQRYRLGRYDSTYCGEFTGGELTGRGAVYYADGGIYHGEVVRARRQGYGVLCSKNCRAEGQWHNGKLHGQATVLYAGDDGTQSTTAGRFENGCCAWGERRSDGFPTYIGPFKETFLDGEPQEVPHGRGFSIDPKSGLKREVEYDNGRFIPPGWRQLQATSR